MNLLTGASLLALAKSIYYWIRLDVIVDVWNSVACVASISVWVRNKKILRNGIFDVGHAKNGARAKKWKSGEGEGKGKHFPTPPRSFTRPTFRAVFDFRSSFFVPKPGSALWQEGEKIGVGEKKKKKKKKNGERSGPRSSLGRGISFFSILALTICTEISVKNFRQMVLVFFSAPKTGTGLSCTTYKIPVNFSLSLDLKPGTGDPNKWYRKFRSFR